MLTLYMLYRVFLNLKLPFRDGLLFVLKEACTHNLTLQQMIYFLKTAVFIQNKHHRQAHRHL